MNPTHSVDIQTPTDENNTNPNSLPQICLKNQKVPEHIRWGDRSRGAYDPKVVSFGPYHHGKPELQTCEEVKHLALQMFVQGSNHDREFFKAKVLEVISEARDCYLDGSTEQYTNEQFAEMMLLDSCFLIYIIYIITVSPQSPQDHLNYLPVILRLGSLDHSLIFQDVFLMENQIPFKILMHLITLIFNDGKDKVRQFLQRAAWDTSDQKQNEHIKQQLEASSPLHLLGALHAALVWDDTPKSLTERVQSYINQRGIGKRGKLPKAYRSAKDLKAKGLHFRPSFNKSLKAINFKSFGFCGKLELPPTYASSLSKIVFLNLIAYELCPNNVLDFTVIHYVNFMKSLIVSADDVKELREKKVLLTSWTDEAVVRFYEDLDTFDIEAVDKYMKVKEDIQKHYDSKANKWMAELFYTHFSTPWLVVAWFAGVVLIVLTVIQTFFTINPK